MEKHGSSAIAPADTTFISITLVRALAIAGIIIENYHNNLRWLEEFTLSDFFTASASSVAGTFVHMFFILSGYGLTLSILKKGSVSWTAWARERFRKIVVP
jgi:peptidoglycan/LPS O-acetylase OafA/YrhL